MVAPAPGADETPSYAGFWRRAGAIFVDIALWAFVLPAYFTVHGLSIPFAILALVLMTVLGTAYPVYFHARWGQTLGKMAVGIKVTRLDGQAITSRDAWVRTSVDAGFAAGHLVATVYVMATWTGPDWSSLGWLERGAEVWKRSTFFQTFDSVHQAWFWSELVVILFNRRRRALHDFLAGTVVVRVRRRPRS
jgi:uncharacterized RDD family membrane protein YckC